MAVTGERTIFHVMFQENYYSIEPNIDMPWRNRGNQVFTDSWYLLQGEKMNQRESRKQKGGGRIDYLTETELKVTSYLFPCYITKQKVLKKMQKA